MSSWSSLTGAARHSTIERMESGDRSNAGSRPLQRELAGTTARLWRATIFALGAAVFATVSVAVGELAFTLAGQDNLLAGEGSGSTVALVGIISASAAYLGWRSA